MCQVPGFNVLQWLLPKHANVPDLYFILMAMLLGQQIKSLPTDVQVHNFCHFQINLRNLFCFPFIVLLLLLPASVVQWLACLP